MASLTPDISTVRIPLRSAMLCLDCEMITEVRLSTCPCGSSERWPLQTWLDKLERAMTTAREGITVVDDRGYRLRLAKVRLA